MVDESWILNKYDCGCLILRPALQGTVTGRPRIKYCPKHAAAPALFDKLTNLLYRCHCADVNGDLSDWVDGDTMQAAFAILEEAKGKGYSDG